MKQVTLTLNLGELDVITDGVKQLLRDNPGHHADSWNRQLLELALRLEGLNTRRGSWRSLRILDVPWAVPYLRKALAEAAGTDTLRTTVKELEERVKTLSKPKPERRNRLKHRAKRKKPAPSAVS